MQTLQKLANIIARVWRLSRQASAEREQLDLVLRRPNAHLRIDAGLESIAELRAASCELARTMPRPARGGRTAFARVRRRSRTGPASFDSSAPPQLRQMHLRAQAKAELLVEPDSA